MEFTYNSYDFSDHQSKYMNSPSNNNHFDASKMAVYVNGPVGINVLLTDEVLHNIKDDSLFSLDVQGNKILMKAVYKCEVSNWRQAQDDAFGRRRHRISAPQAPKQQQPFWIR